MKSAACRGVKKVFVASGIRYDLVLADQAARRGLPEQIAGHHVSGQMKVAPEHSEDARAAPMGKPGDQLLLQFKNLFERRLARSAARSSS